jgi:hypothetical protein
VRERLGWDNQNIREVQPWRKFAGRPPRRSEASLALRWRCSVAAGLTHDALRRVRLATEPLPGWMIRVNGHAPAVASGRWLSADFALLEVGPHLHTGENWIEARGFYDEDSWIESAYLLGDFAAMPRDAQALSVEDGGTLRLNVGAGDWPSLDMAPLLPALEEGAWASQGLPYFGGRLVAAQEVDLDEVPAEAWIEFERVPCATRVRCNDAEAGVIAWRPYRLPLGGRLRPGRNVIEVEVASSLRNLLGPLHADLRDVSLIGPPHFLPGSHWQDAYVLAPEGLPAGGVLVLSGPSGGRREQAQL